MVTFINNIFYLQQTVNSFKDEFLESIMTIKWKDINVKMIYNTHYSTLHTKNCDAYTAYSDTANLYKYNMLLLELLFYMFVLHDVSVVME